MENLNSEEDDVCLICLQMYNQGLNCSDIRTLEVRQNVFNKASKYLSSEIFDGCLRWNFIDEGSSPICQNCYASVENVFKLHEMVEKIEQKIQQLVDSFTSQVVQHHNRLEELCTNGYDDDTSMDDDNLAEKKAAEIVYESENDIDIKEEYGYNSEDGTKIPTTSAVTTSAIEDGKAFENDSLIEEDAAAVSEEERENSSFLDCVTELDDRDCNVSFQYPGLHLKQLRVTLTRLKLNPEVNISETLEQLEGVPRPKRKAALAATASIRKIKDADQNIKKRKLQERNKSDTDWESEDDSNSVSSNGSFEDKIESTDRTVLTSKTIKRPTIFEMAKRFKCQSEFCISSFNFTKELTAHSSESGHNNPKLYKCDRKNCSKDFFNKASMKNHVKFHHKKNQFKCKRCHKTFTQKRALQIHQYNSHIEKMFKCDNCEQAFLRKVNLTNHIKLHAGKYFECKLCPAIYLWNISLKKHIQIAHNGVKHKCNLCGRKCKSKLQLTQHRSVHFKLKVNKIFPCAACKKIHFVENIWDSCIIKHFRKDKQAGFICAICTSVFEKGEDLDIHSKKAGHLNKKLFQCGICKKRFYKRVVLKSHKKVRCHKTKVKIIKAAFLFKCHICSKGFRERYIFNDHNEWHKDPDKFKCEDCGKRYNNRFSLREHKKMHSDVKHYSCKVCAKEFRRHTELWQHSKSCLPIKKPSENVTWECKFCDKVYKTEGGLSIHRKIHKGKKTLITCKICGKVIKRCSYKYHMLTYHSTEKSFQCQKCEKSFNFKAKLERHEISAHTEDRPFLCTVCDAKFKTKSALNIHIRRSHKSDPVVCDICGKKFTHAEYLHRHLKLHKGTSHRCTYEFCTRKFYEKSKLNLHIKVAHTKEIQFSCDLCQKTFPSSVNLNVHLRTHTREKPFPCKHCEKKFHSKPNLKLHTDRIHAEKRYQCDVCKKCFSGKDFLKNHENDVHGEKKFQCEFCPYSCRMRHHLNLHIEAKHSGKRPFVCDICGKAFARKDVLGGHIKWHTKMKAIEDESADCETDSD